MNDEKAIRAAYSAAMRSFLDTYMQHVDSKSLALLRWSQFGRSGADAWGLGVNHDTDRDGTVEGG